MWLFQRQEAAARARAKAEQAKARKAARRRSRKKKRVWPKKPYDPSQVQRIPVTSEQVETLVALAKGRVSAHEGAWFYGQLIRFSNGLAQTPEQVRQHLEDAYWVEEDDLRQQIDILLWVLQNKDQVVRDEYYRLAAALRMHLIRDQKVLRPDMSHLEAMYQYDIEMDQMDQTPEPNRNLDIVLESNHMYSTFDRYVIYLYHHLGKTEKELADTLLLGMESAIKIKQNLDRKIQDVKEKNNGEQNTSRRSSPILTVFTCR